MITKSLIAVSLILLTYQVKLCGGISIQEKKEIWRETVGENLKTLLEIGGQELFVIGYDLGSVLKEVLKITGKDPEKFDNVLSMVSGKATNLMTVSWDVTMDYINGRIAEKVLDEESAEFLREHLQQFKTLNMVLKGIKLWRRNTNLVKQITGKIMEIGVDLVNYIS
eukprot:TCONS_00017817-protein